MARSGGSLDGSRPRVLVASKRGRFMVGEPLFDRGWQLNLSRGRVRVAPGGIALCRVDRRGAQPIVDLGRADNARDVVGALLADRGLRPTFRDRHEDEARRTVERLAADPGARRDLTAEPTFTVDPASARDFDDAVSARRVDGGGFHLWIHIADVSAHVKPESGLDREALERANSTYAPGLVSPMLPQSLSGDACSLVPGVERLAVTAEIELADSGEVRSASFYRSTIRSDERLDYDRLDRIFAGRERPPEHVAAAIEASRAAAAALASQRKDGLTVSGDEPEFTFADDGSVAAAHAVRQTEAHRLIERLMILTNEQVARLLENKSVPALYRVHEQPDPARVRVLIDQLAALDVPTPAIGELAGPSEAGEVAIEASRLVAAEAARRGHGAASLSSLVLRAMKPARYSAENLGHAGLGSSAYAHFTSPIRRYPDLIAHRALLSAVDGGEERPSVAEVEGAALHCSDRERDSMKIERSGDDVCAAFLLERELFERGREAHFDGEVSGVIGAGAFVRFRGELADVYEGFYPARRMPGERYEVNETESALIGLRTGTRVGIGDAVEVKVDSVEAPRGRVDLTGVEQAPPREKGSGPARKGQGHTQGRNRRRAGAGR